MPTSASVFQRESDCPALTSGSSRGRFCEVFAELVSTNSVSSRRSFPLPLAASTRGAQPSLAPPLPPPPLARKNHGPNKHQGDPAATNGGSASNGSSPPSTTTTKRRRPQQISSYSWEDYGEEVRLTFRQSEWEWARVEVEEIGVEWGLRRFRMSIDSRYGIFSDINLDYFRKMRLTPCSV